jgi:hypothetical protein
MEIIIVFTILALVVTFVCLGVVGIIRGIARGAAAVSRPTRRTPPPLPCQPTGASAVYAAFNAPFSDGSAELCSALTDNLLLEHYRANLGKVAGHSGDDLERFSTDLAEMLIVHMEIASRFAAMTHNKQRTRG